MTLTLKQHAIGSKVPEFLDVVDYIYKRDPNYVRPLDMDMKDRLSSKNPFFEHGDGVLFTAYRNGFCVGRCTAQVDRAHLARFKDDAGCFGFFDTVEDVEVARLLLDAAAQWLRARGMKKIRGPFSLSLNEEVGCLVEGFDMPPMVLMPHHLPYQGRLIEQCGFQKLKDMYAWRYTVGDVPPRARRASDEIAALPEVKLRHINMRNLDQEVRTIMDVHNDAWSDNWGFVPFTEKELSKMAADLKLIAIPELTYIAEVEGEAAAVVVALPNVNELIRDMKGKLGPFELGKLLWRLKVKGPKTARLPILGIRKKYRNQRKYAGLSIYLYDKINEAGRRVGVEWGELSYTLEDNGPVNAGIRLIGGKIYKRYRTYEKST